MMREEEWIEAARQGDQDAFAELVRLYEKRVFALTTRMCRNPEDAAEAGTGGVSLRLAGAAVFPGRGQLFHLALSLGLQCLRGSAAPGGPPPGCGRGLSG